MIVTAPSSTANLGPGFDCLALALDLPFRLAVGVDLVPDESGVARFHGAESAHPAAVAFRSAGGDPSVTLQWASPIPPGRGLGYSGAARVAGAYAAGVLDGLDHRAARAGAHVVASRLEGHPDNSAASAFGGFTVAVEDRVMRLDVPAGLSVVVWSPSSATSTDASRRSLPARVALGDAAFSVARAAAWVAAIATGDLDALREACEDRLHQDLRLQQRPDAAEVRDHLLGRGEVLAAWLSGSGPSIAALVPSDLVPMVAGSVGGGGSVRTLGIDALGVRVR
ncbi:MAG: homoserine kinase [Actinobacteria bacterium]|nr:homoserine kinase [Actinomycetota bacterium]